MSFSSNVKSELCKLPIDDMSPCCRRAELCGVICFAAVYGTESTRIKTEHNSVARRIYLLYKALYNQTLDIEIKKPPHRVNHSYNLALPHGDTRDTLGVLCVDGDGLYIGDDIGVRDCCRRALLRGAFLGGGSIAAPESGYHTELVTRYQRVADAFGMVAEQAELPLRSLVRRSHYVFYIKDSEVIGDLLTLMGAPTKMMDLINIKIIKEMRNSTNRLVNAESANIDKTVDASVRQLDAIQRLSDGGKLIELSPELRQVAALRVEYPELALSELAAMMPEPTSKSTVYYRLKRIMQLAEQIL